MPDLTREQIEALRDAAVADIQRHCAGCLCNECRLRAVLIVLCDKLATEVLAQRARLEQCKNGADAARERADVLGAERDRLRAALEKIWELSPPRWAAHDIADAALKGPGHA